MQLQLWKKKGTFFHYKSHQIFTLDEGVGEVVLLIHGFPTASWDWAKVWPFMAEKYRLVTLDMIGFGFSDKPKGYHYNIFDQADLIESFLKLKGIHHVHILSHDYGDTVAQELLARAQGQEKPEDALTIKSVCLLNGGLFPETHRPLLVQKLLMSPIGSFVSYFFTRKKLAQNFRKIFGPLSQPSETELDHFWHLISTNNGKRVFHRLIRYMRERAENRERWVGALQETSIPLLVINGSEDSISGRHMVSRLRQLVPDPNVIELNGIGHYPNVEAPEIVTQHYLDFLSEV